MRRTPLALVAPLLLVAAWVGCCGVPAATATAASPDSAWRWPLGGTPTVVRPFRPPPSPYAAGHRGVDLAAAAGSPVFAAGAGVVGYAGLLAGRGVVTVVHPGGLRTEYEPVRATVRAGQHVVAGTRLGVVHGRHHGCGSACLHWGLRDAKGYLDPLSLFGSGPVRLLPLGGAAPVPPPLPASTSPIGGGPARWGSSSGAMVAAGIRPATGPGGPPVASPDGPPVARPASRARRSLAAVGVATMASSVVLVGAGLAGRRRPRTAGWRTAGSVR